MSIVYRELVQVAAAVRAQQENQAREATDFLYVGTAGAGQLVFEEPHVFANPFVGKPHLSYGSEVTSSPDLDVYQQPRCTGSVLRWERNDRGFYTAAHVYVSVDVDVLPEVTAEEAPYALVEHHFAFRGLSYKHLGRFATSEVGEPTLTTRATPF